MITWAVHSFHCSFAIKPLHLPLEKISQYHIIKTQGISYYMYMYVLMVYLIGHSFPLKTAGELENGHCARFSTISTRTTDQCLHFFLSCAFSSSTCSVCTECYIYSISKKCWVHVHVQTCSWACSVAMVSLRVLVSCTRASLSVVSNWERSSPTAESCI